MSHHCPFGNDLLSSFEIQQSVHWKEFCGHQQPILTPDFILLKTFFIRSTNVFHLHASPSECKKTLCLARWSWFEVGSVHLEWNLQTSLLIVRPLASILCCSLKFLKFIWLVPSHLPRVTQNKSYPVSHVMQAATATTSWFLWYQTQISCRQNLDSNLQPSNSNLLGHQSSSLGLFYIPPANHSFHKLAASVLKRATYRWWQATFSC